MKTLLSAALAVLRVLGCLLLLGASRALARTPEGAFVVLVILLLAAGYLCWLGARACWRAVREKPQEENPAGELRQEARPCPKGWDSTGPSDDDRTAPQPQGRPGGSRR
jgi:threonine/homoserine/homoserine lactone efflux protein